MSAIPSADKRQPPPTPSVVVLQRETQLEIPARREDAQRIAFSRRRLAVLGDERWVVWDLASWKLLASIPVQQPRRLAVMADGAFVVAAGDVTLRLEQHETQPALLPRLLLLPRSHLWPDRRAALTLWVPVGRTLYQYQLPGPDNPPATRLVPSAEHPLPDCDEQGFVGLNDGSFLFTAGSDLTRFFPAGKSVKGPAPVDSANVWRLLPAPRIDRAWLATVDGNLKLLDFNRDFAVVGSLQLGETPFDIAVDGERMAVVSTTQGPNQPRRWAVTLLDTEGKRLFEHELPPAQRPDQDDWVAQEIRNRGVVLAPNRPWLAVGGPDSVTVWRTDNGKVVFAHRLGDQESETNQR